MSRISALKGSLFAMALPLAFACTAGTALADCKNGFVWREAATGDDVCVTPQQRSFAKIQNANGPGYVEPGGGAYGPNTCRQGYVWREAFDGDAVCVTPDERRQAADENAAGPDYTD